MGHAERLATAMVSDDLGLSPLAVKDADYLIAMGWIGINRRLATGLYRLMYSLDAARYGEVLASVRLRVKELDRRHRWLLKPGEHNRLAKAALDFMICPVCPSCLGRGRHLVSETAPVLEDEHCQHCNGTGRRQTETKRLADVLSDLEASQAALVGMARKRIGGHFEAVL